MNSKPHSPVYLDYQATTPVDQRVLDAMNPYFTKSFGNPASRSHSFGWTAEAGVVHAREKIAESLGILPIEIVFTSGATESNCMAILGVTRKLLQEGKKGHLIVSGIEHKSVLEAAQLAAQEGFDLTILPVTEGGQVEVSSLLKYIRPETKLVSIMVANNETGVLQPVQEIGAICRQRGILFHTDATQAIGKIPLDLKKIQADLCSFTSHKLYGPKGVGALFIRKSRPKIPLSPLLVGGGQERGLRSGTLNVPGIVGFARALEISIREIAVESIRLQSFRDRALARFQSEVPGTKLNGNPTERLPHTLNISFPHVASEALVVAMRDVAVSSGSACASISTEPSYVLRAMGLPQEEIKTSIRMSFGRMTTEEDFEFSIQRMIETIHSIQSVWTPKSTDDIEGGTDHDRTY